MACDDRTIQEKKRLREKFIQLRNNLPKDVVEKKSLLILEKLIRFEKFVQAKDVMIYYPFRNEVNVLSLISYYQSKNYYFPVINFNTKKLIVRRYNGKFYENKFGILEPVYENNDVEYTVLDFIIVPGVVFDTRCYRIGYGGGFYDKLLKNVRCTSCGVCFEEQIVDVLPTTNDDVPVDYVFSDERILYKENKV